MVCVVYGPTIPRDSCQSCQLPPLRTPPDPPVLAHHLPLTLNPTGRIAHHLYPRWNTRLGSVTTWSNMEPRGHRAGKSSSFEGVACHMIGLINRCRGTQSRVFALSNSGTGLEAQATSTAISHSAPETSGRTQILLAALHPRHTRASFKPTVWKWGALKLTVTVNASSALLVGYFWCLPQN